MDKKEQASYAKTRSNKLQTQRKMVYKTGSRNNIPIYWSTVSFSETTSPRDFCFARLQVNKTTRQRVGGSRWSFAGIMELRIGRVGSKLKAQSLSIPFYTFYTLYTHSSLLTVVMRQPSVVCCPLTVVPKKSAKRWLSIINHSRKSLGTKTERVS